VQQEVFLEVWRRGPSYDPARAGLGTWIMMIARSRAIDAPGLLRAAFMTCRSFESSGFLIGEQTA